MSIPESIVREIERAISAAECPGGMSVHDGKARVGSSYLRRLLAELAALRAERDGLIENNRSLANSCRTYKDERDTFRAENERLRADAERLEWYFGPASKADWLDTFMTGFRENWTVDQWRAAIDAAMERADET